MAFSGTPLGVVAGPGTGKTYSVIKRLEHIIKNDLADPEKVLVLCYSRSAVHVIQSRLELAIAEGRIPDTARALYPSIRTFDSFVTYMLSGDESAGITLNTLDYDQRIEKFMNEFKHHPDTLDGLEFLIVDEMQDIVSVRARMVMDILQNIKCGFLLLGDKCQAIYDFSVKDENEINSYKYYKWLERGFATDVQGYELTENKRQRKDLASLTNNIREAILEDCITKQNEAMTYCVRSLDTIGNIKSMHKKEFENINAILCRNNAMVASVSEELYSKGTNHIVTRDTRHVVIATWLADLLSEYSEKKLGYSVFTESVRTLGYVDPDEKWNALKTVEGDNLNERVLDIKLMIRNLLALRKLPDELDGSQKHTLMVSTIHSAKGKEFDNVLLVKNDFESEFDDTNEVRVGYVASTRGKHSISFLDTDKLYVKKLDSGRLIGTGRYGQYKAKRSFCKNIIVGRNGDVDYTSFVDNYNDNIYVDNVFTDAKEKQEYIKKMKPGDVLEAYLEDDGIYYLYNKGYCIGSLTRMFSNDMRAAMQKTNKSPNLPTHLFDIRCTNVVTIVSTNYYGNINEIYNKSGIWLGVEVHGFAKTHWE